MTATGDAPAVEPADDDERFLLRLYIAGQTSRSVRALRNLEQLCRIHLAGRYEIEVVDLLQHPGMAKEHDIIAIPTLVRQLPPPIRKIIGDLSDEARVLIGLEVHPGGG
jgi:circadian clock protein KaiB